MSDMGSRETIGCYRVVRELGSGATGTVFLAERIQDFEQTVVLKVMRWTPIANLAPGSVESEHVILRSLEHPNIVALLDHGRMPDGAPVLVLEYLDGTAINAWCDHHRLTIRERLVLLGQVFSAVSYAHSHLVLHGDIKPANVMVTTVPSGSGLPVAKLLDFGVSHWLHGGRAIPGLAGATLAYASPEQRHGKPLTVATDVFALGVLMSSLLSGVETGLDGRESGMSGRFSHFDSSRQNELAAHRGTTPRALARLLRGSLDSIVQKATAFTPEKRYVSVTAMAEDVSRYLKMLETSVYPLQKPQQALLWIRRHAWLAGLTSIVFATLLIGGSLTLWHHHRVVLQEQATHARLLELSHLTDDLSGTLYRSTESLSGSEQARASLLRAASAARDAVAQESTHDPVLSLELVRQYEAAAELELAQNNKDSSRQATREIDAANSLLKFVPDSQARHEIVEKINGLQMRRTTSP